MTDGVAFASASSFNLPASALTPVNANPPPASVTTTHVTNARLNPTSRAGRSVASVATEEIWSSRCRSGASSRRSSRASTMRADDARSRAERTRKSGSRRPNPSPGANSRRAVERRGEIVTRVPRVKLGVFSPGAKKYISRRNTRARDELGAVKAGESERGGGRCVECRIGAPWTRTWTHRAVSVARADGVVEGSTTTRRSVSSKDDARRARSATISRTLALSKILLVEGDETGGGDRVSDHLERTDLVAVDEHGGGDDDDVFELTHRFHHE